MTDQLVEILYFVSTWLLLPTLVVLLLFVAGTLIMLGGLLREVVERWGGARAWRGFLDGLQDGKIDEGQFFDLRLNGYPAVFQNQTAAVRNKPLVVRKCLEDLEMDIARRLGLLAFVTRVGPMLGLVGTLVPLGPALTGLASGDVEALSGNLVIAFTTTVFGILVGGFAYAASLVRRAWYEQDLSDLEFIASLLPSDDAAHGTACPEPSHHQEQRLQGLDEQDLGNGKNDGAGLLALNSEHRHA